LKWLRGTEHRPEIECKVPNQKGDVEVKSSDHKSECEKEK
jgi:hypothetical protein